MDVTGKSVVVLTGKVRYWDLNVSTAQVDAAAVEVMSVRVNSTSKADVTITAPERLEASVGTKAGSPASESPSCCTLRTP